MTWRMQSSHFNAFSYFEGLSVFENLGDGQAFVTTPNNGELAELFELNTHRRVSDLAEYIYI